jgi:hypothetical protein
MRIGLGIGLNRFRGGQAAAITGLLDQYTGAAAAFSLDTLIYGDHSVEDTAVGSQTNGSTDTYTVRVRRSSDNAVRSFTHTEVGDGTLVTWVGAGNDGFVEAWYNQGSADDAVQTTAANQPKIVSDGQLILENGKAAIDFDGANDFLATNTGIALPIYNFSVVRHEGVFKNASGYLGQKEGRIAFGQGDFTPPSAFWTWTPNVASSYGEANSRDNIRHLHSYYIPDAIESNWKYYRDSVEKGAVGLSSGTPLTDAGPAVYIGYSGFIAEYWSGPLQTTIVFQSDQSTNRTAIESALNDYYEIY